MRSDEEVIKELEEASYRFAKTMPENPHFYTLSKTWGSSEGFHDAVMLILRLGEVEIYKGWEYVCFHHHGFKYWTMDKERETVLINRKTVV